ncbi:hypothetical protein RJ640_000706 [Escallonia rubra]|uniref:Bet v I/Major latex protein domain-containing protein n=1 Tax=Escallonia rubra TaxID=112253 RepID=A0AA88UBF8_9ASTE|nr:hypothetical protein RJ640_000706 [Escallonia rubra]
MHGTLSDGLEVNVPAQEAWQIYGTLQITHVTHTFDKIEVLKGDGGVGTILNSRFRQGTGDAAAVGATSGATTAVGGPSTADNAPSSSQPATFLTTYVLIETVTTVFSSYEEMYAKVDDKKMIKEAEVISGGYLDLGFTLYRTVFEIIETSKTSCITKATIEYDVNEEDVANFTYVSILPMISMMKDIATYLLENAKS